MKINHNTALRLGKLSLLPYLAAHVDTYHRWMQSHELQELTASEPLTLEEEYAMQQSWARDENKCTFILHSRDMPLNYEAPDSLKQYGGMIGDVNLFLDAEDATIAELELMIAGRQQLGIKIFRVKIGFDNTASIALFERLGFAEVSRSDFFREVTMETSASSSSSSSAIQLSVEKMNAYENIAISSTADLPKATTAARRLFLIDAAHDLAAPGDKCLPILDTPDQLLLPILDEALNFIDQQTEAATVVVCQAGVSRSAAVVTAYIMRKEQTDPFTALATLQSRYPPACPAPSFMYQLYLYQLMGYKFDAALSQYRKFQLSTVAHRTAGAALPDFDALLVRVREKLAESAPSSAVAQDVRLRCQKCRKIVVEADSVLGDHRRERQGAPCASILIEPPEWLQDELSKGDVEGKIVCAMPLNAGSKSVCGAKLGVYRWQGCECSCGEWVCPAFLIQKSKVDLVK
ncbi:N-acetyltransferase 9 [Sorochytrium milnesiophthora]